MTTIYNINELENLSDCSSVKVCGIINEIRRIPKKQDPSKFLEAGNIEDSTGEIEFIALPDISKKYYSMLKKNKEVIITGEYKKSADNSSFIDVKSVMPYKITNNETIYTGFTELDKLTGGFKKGELILIAGRPAMGKTAFAMDIARNIREYSKK